MKFDFHEGTRIANEFLSNFFEKFACVKIEKCIFICFVLYLRIRTKFDFIGKENPDVLKSTGIKKL